MIVETTILKDVLPRSGYRTVAFGALGGNGTMQCFHPDGIWITSGQKIHPAPDAWVALSINPLPGSPKALVPGDFAFIPRV